MSKRETVEEFLKRGGSITKVPAQETPTEETHKVTPMSSPGGLMTLAEGSIFYSEIKATPPKKKKPLPEINVAALPASLLKFVTKKEE